MKKFLITLAYIVTSAFAPAFCQSLDYDKLAPHPRLLLRSGDIEAMKKFCQESANARKVHDKIIADAESFLLKEPVVFQKDESNKRILLVSREALKRIFYLSYAYKMTDDNRYAARAEKEMLAVSDFHSWNPSHFLDVGEMTMALAIGYDWLYDYLSRHSRSIIGTAIYEKGLKAQENEKHAWFYTASNNWNQVCNAGMIYGALATMERSPEYNKALIAKCLESNPIAQKCYDPDGAYPEGYSYWDYGTGFEVMLVAALQSALGTDAGIASQESFMRSAEFMTYMEAPTGKNYNYADSGSGVHCTPSKYWFARQRGDASLVVTDEMHIAGGKLPNDRLLPIYMIFGSALDFKSNILPKNKVWVGAGEVPLYIYRSGWQSKEDTYFAIKGGHAYTNHAHMDAGSFIYEWSGVRWSLDLGSHSYAILEKEGIDLWNRKQNSERWTVFRLGQHSHGVLTFNERPHNVEGIATIVDSHSSAREKWVELDLTPTFKGQVVEVRRRAELDKNDYLTITDHVVVGDTATNAEWKIATNAEAEIVTPTTIKLEQDGKTIYLKLKTKASGEAKIWPEHKYYDFELPDNNLRRVGFVVQLKAGQTVDIEVSFSPNKSKGLTLPKLNLGKRNK